MRLVYIHQYFKTPEMEGGTRSYEVARRLVARGIQVDIVTSDNCYSSSRRVWRHTIEDGIDVHWASVPYSNNMSYGRRLAAFGSFMRLAAKRAAGIPHDVLLATSTPLTVAIPGAYAAWRNNAPMILEVRDVWPEVPIALGALPLAARPAATALEAFAYRRAAHVVALSPDMAASIERRFPETKISVIPNGCDTDLFMGADDAGRRLRNSLPWLGDRRLILYAGTLGLVNGVDYIVKMASRLLEISPDTRIAIVGSGRDEGRIRSIAAERGVLGRNLHMCGGMPKAKIAAFFSACDLSMSTVIDVPELCANSANKVFDAFAAGRPVAINHGGWIAKTLSETGAGLLLPNNDPRSAATSVTGFLDDSVRVSAARKAASLLANGMFSRDVLFDQFLDVLFAVARTSLVPA